MTLEKEHLRLLMPVMQQAQDELGQQLKTWIERAPNGGARFTAWKYRTALLQLKVTIGTLEDGLNGRLVEGGAKAQRLALRHLKDEIARFSTVYGKEAPPMRFNLAHLMATGERALVPRYRNSAHRYAWDQKNGVWGDIKRRLAVEILKGSSVNEMIERLQEMGGPRGAVSLRGMAGDPGAVVEEIPEGLFKRYRFWAERIVRTELANAYGVQMLDGLDFAKGILPDLQKRWSSDGSGCVHICQPADGQVVELNEEFILGAGFTADAAPGHPNCRCRTGPWRPHWGALLDSLGAN